MAISEIVKQDAETRKSQIDSRIRMIDANIAEHQAAINSLTAEKKQLSELRVAYDKDIPKPTVKAMVM